MSTISSIKEVIDSSLEPVEVFDPSIFGEHWKQSLPLFCAENGYKLLYQPSRCIYLILRVSGDNRWEIVV